MGNQQPSLHPFLASSSSSPSPSLSSPPPTPPPPIATDATDTHTSKSYVWKHFRRGDKHHTCIVPVSGRECGTKIKNQGSTTTNLRGHLLSKHKIHPPPKTIVAFARCIVLGNKLPNWIPV